MKKQLVLVGIVVLLVCVGLSGCNEIKQNNTPITDNRIIGTWVNASKDVNGDNYTLTMSFDTDGYWSQELSTKYGNTRIDGNWVIDTQHNKLTVTRGDYKDESTYAFIDNNTLRLTPFTSGSSMIFTKQ